jgi:hypothetical protein
VVRLSELGITSGSLLPSANSLIPLFVLNDTWSSDGFDIKRALYWFLLANRDGRYSGSAITTLNEDVRTIKDASSFNDALRGLLSHLETTPKIDQEEFLKRYDRAGNKFLRLLVYLLEYEYCAVDWLDNNFIAFRKGGGPAMAGFEPQWHHIFPKAVLKNSGVSADEINSLSNITVLNESTNVKKLQAKPPSAYIREYNISAESLRTHAIPDSFAEAVTRGGDVMEWQWDARRFPIFLAERAQELAKRATEFIVSLDPKAAGALPASASASA